ncbi:hypothetical protein WJX81_004999 [Elliptochloris bilobata]|uniref:Uncharacterized protein n=1 Tax=Elliptochloris bilobata TaxID=381761 RepID=A0AAW1QZB6_9CHLO
MYRLSPKAPGSYPARARPWSTRALCVECGQHRARVAVDTAWLAIQHFVGGPHAAYGPPRAITVIGAKFVRSGYRWLLPQVAAFQRVAAGQAVAEDDCGKLHCPEEHGAELLLVVPTQAPVIGEEAVLWGRLD